MSMIMAVFLLVPIVAPGVGAGLIAVLPWRAVFWAPAAIMIGLMLWAAKRLPETLPPERRRPFTWHAVGQAGQRGADQPRDAQLHRSRSRSCSA